MQRRSFDISNGLAWPLGVTHERSGYNFAIMVMNAKEVALHLFEKNTFKPLKKLKLNPAKNKTGNVWHVYVSGLSAGDSYIFKVKKRLNGKEKEYNLLDPYSKAYYSNSQWGVKEKINLSKRESVLRVSVIPSNGFNWQNDTPLKTPLNETIIYELHVRGFTKHSTSAVKYPGTYRGLVEKIPYLKKLGITAVELLPVFDFDENDIRRKNPNKEHPLKNFWGYDPISFFALKNTFAHNSHPMKALEEFRAMVKAFHTAGIEIILDVVFNHTAEAGKRGPIYNFKGLANNVYYLLDEKEKYANYSGCGNTFSCNHPVVRDMIIKALRYWVLEMYVDGFRFDLASILCRGRDGQPTSNPVIIDQISNDPVLSGTKLIAEPWDAGGLYQVGSFPGGKDWLEWNGKFRDDIRQFIKGDKGLIPALAKRLYGSSDLYEKDKGSPLNSVNFISCHDGFPMADLVQYNNKNNLANGEDNRDGENHNHSYNYGVEGPTDDPEINRLRHRQLKNMASILFLAQGIPMFYAGDEFGRTQKGNNNAYCQDNEIGWVDWGLADKNKDLLRFFQKMIAFRKTNPLLKKDTYIVHSVKRKKEVTWHGTEINKAHWDSESKVLALLYRSPDSSGRNIFIMINGASGEKVFHLPKINNGKRWKRLSDTFQESPADITDSGKEFPIENQKKYTLAGRSVAVFIS
jgi:glycogen operon protein